MTSTVDPGPVRARAGRAWPAVAGLLLLATLAPEPAHAQTGICGRTEVVRDALVALVAGVSDCALVTDTHLAAITGELDLEGELDPETGNYVPKITALAAGDFDGLTSLTTLDLSFNDLTTLPDGVFDELTSLTTLELLHNNDLTLTDGVFDELTSLTGLYLFNNGLTTLPDGVFDELTSLTHLQLHHNNDLTLPDGVFDGLTSLNVLQLHVNGLTSLPDGVFDELTSLLSLFLNHNELTSLPDGVFNELTSLTGLFLNDNKLTTLPDGVFNELTSLTTLNLQENPGAPFAPTAVALPDDGTIPLAGGTVTLDGSASGGAWGTNVTYSWALTNPANGVTVTFDDNASAKPVVTIPALAENTELTFTLTVTGQGGTHGISPATATATVTARANTAPDATDATVSTDEDTAYDFDASDFNFTDDDSGDTLASVKITSLLGSGKGSLTLDGSAVTADQVVSGADIDADKLVYNPPANANGDDYASFGFKVSDGTDESVSAYTMTIDVTAVNDAATGEPAISGTARVGSELTAAKGTIADVEGLTSVSYSYQWIRVDGTEETDITGATSSTYTLVAADQGKKVKVRLGFTDDGGTGEARTSAAYPDGATVLPPPAVLISGADDLKTGEDGTTATFQVRLAAAPVNEVTVTPSSSDTGEGTVSGALTFTTTNWNTARTVTVTGVDDADVDGEQSFSITFRVESTDPGYAGISVPAVSVTNADDEPLALILDAIATDNTVNIAEKAAGFAISGATGSQGGVSVTVTVGTTELTATSVAADPATWSVAVPANAAYLTGTSVAVAVSASKTGYTAPGDVTRTLAVDLAAPSATYTAPSSLQVGVAIGAMTPSTTDPDIASYGATGLPSGLGIDTGTGVIDGTPATADANTADATVTVTDTAGNTATVDITFPAVAKGDQTLTGFAYSPATVTYGDTAPTVTAPGGVQTTLLYSATPATVCTVDASTGALILAGVGDCVITATAAGAADYNEATAAFTVTVAAAGALALTLDAIATDNTVNIAEKAAGFAISGATGSEGGVSVTVTVGTTELTATSAAADPATWSVAVPANAAYLTGTSVTVTVSASKTGYTAPGDVTRTVAVDLAAPSATYTAPSSLQVGVAVGAMTPSTTDPDIASYGATGLPSGLGIDTGTGVIDGTPDTADANAAEATVTVTDTAGNTVDVPITFPAVAKGDQTLTGFAYSPATVTHGDTAPAVTAPGGVQTTLSYSATPATVCTVDASSGALTLAGVGECVITATAAPSDDYNQGTATYTVTVAAAGTLALTLDAIATDNTVNIAEKAAGFAISGATGSQGGVSVTVTVGTTELTATSAAADPATWSVAVPANAAYLTGTSVTVTVSASKTGYTAPGDVTRTVAVDLTAPSATYTAPSSLQVGAAIGAMTPSTTDPDIASYGATGLPSGLGIDTGTGVIDGTPATADANTAEATVTVTDTAGNTATVDITFPAVAKGDQTLTGFAYSPASVTYGDTAPAVTAPGGVQTTLSYSATPATVCTVDASSGALTLAGVGECVITATAAPSDDYNQGTATYTVTVAAAGTLALTLDAIATDNTVNIAEKAAGFAISGATGSQGGVSVTVTVGTTELTATSVAADPATWSVAVPANAAYLTGTSVTVTVSASKTGYTAPGDVTRALAVDLAAPSATYTAPSSLQVGAAIGAMTPSTTDPDIASYGATGLPPGLGIDTGTGVIDGTPDTADANAADATVTVTDTAGNTVDVPITFPAVAKGDQTLTGFAYSPATVTYGDTAPTVTPPTGAQTTLSYSATPATVCTVDASSGALTLAGVGECVITATAAPSDDYNQGTATYTVTVAAAGTLALTLDAIATDNTVNIAEKAAGFAISGATGSQGGVSVTVTVGTTELTATSVAADPATWSVAVPANAAYLTGTSVAVAVSASKTGYTAPGDVTRTVAVDLAAPSATYTAPSSLQVGAAVGAMTPSTTDPDIASYGATGLPPGLGIDTGTGVIDGTPATADANTAAATVTVTDTAGNTATVDITFPAVAKGDQTLTGFAYSPASVTYGDTAPAVTAPGGVQTTLSYSATPATVCTVDASSGALTLAGVGECVITATAAGAANYNEATAAFTVTVAAAGTLALTLDAIATDNTVNIAEKAAGFAISGATGSQGGVSVTVTVGTTELTATSVAADPATWSVAVPANAAYLTGTSVAVTVSASKTGYTAPGDVTRTVAVDLTAPSATYTAPSSLQVGVAVGAMTPSTTDPDIASYGATGLPPGLGIDTGTGVIDGTPATADANTAEATVTVTDTAGNTATVDITFPAVAKGDQTLTGFAYSPATVTYGDTAPAVTAPGGVQTTLSYSATPATVCTVDASSGALTLAGVGECVITATAAGAADYNEATAAFTVTVAAAGALALTLDAIATDNTVNIAEKAAGFAISGATGSEGGVSVTVTVGTTELTATSVAADPATWSVAVPANAAYLTGTSVAVTVSASKTGYTAPSDVTRTVAVDLAAPSATYTAPSSLQVGVAVGAMTPSTTDPDIASYGATGLPSGLGIDTGTGVIDGTPDTADANTADATVTVTDTAGNTVDVPITFPAVAKGDQTLTGFAYSPATVTYGDTAPAVTAPGGVQTTLSYSATPATVCTVDASSGALTLAGVGECVITATAAPSDDYNQGTATYTVTVAAAGTLALTLDAIATDNTVNIAEKAAGFAISGATGSQGGVSVTVTVGGTDLTATSAAADPATWSVAVPANAAYLTGTSVTVTVSASKTGYTAPGDVTRTVAVDLAAPSATYTAPSSLQVGAAVGAMTPSTTDPDIASYGATGLPSGLGIDTGTGVIDGTPDTADANAAEATVTVTDTAGNTVDVPITFPAVAKGDQTLTGFAYSPATVTYGDTAPAVTAPGGVQTTLSYSATPATVCTVDASSGALTLAGVGECVITATAAPSDDYNQGTATYTVTVAAAGTLALTLDAIATDNTVNIAEKAAGFAISGATGSQGGVSVTVTVGTTELTATSAAADPATWSVAVPANAAYLTGTSVTVTVSASKTGYTAPSDVTRTLAVDLAAPSATYTAPSSLQVGVAVGAMTPSTTDADIASYGATGLPPGLGIDTGTGVIDGTPDTADANTAEATVTVTDTAGNTDTVSITFPAVAKGDQTLTGFAYSPATVTYGDTAPTVTPPTGVQTTLSYSAAPEGVCTVDPSTGALTLAGVGECVITATAASSADYNQGTAIYTVTVPELTLVSVWDAQAGEGEDMTFTVWLSKTTGTDVTADWTASIERGDTAAAADLGSTTRGTVTVAAGSRTGTFSVATADDATDEENETFTVRLSNLSSNSQIGDPGATGTIIDDDVSPFEPATIRSVTVVSGPGAEGVWSTGERVEVEVRYDKPVVVERPDCWTYNADGSCRPPGPYVLVAFRSDARPGYGEVLSDPPAPYESGSGTDRLRFAYTVGADEDGARGVWPFSDGMLLRGATIRTLEGGEGASRYTRTGVLQVTVEPRSGAWTAGDRVRVKVRFAGSVQYTPPAEPQNLDRVEVTGGTPTIGLLVGDPEQRRLARTASYERGSGTDTLTLTFEYAVTGGDGRVSAVEVVADSLARNGATIRNEHGYDAELDHLGTLWHSSLADRPGSTTEPVTMSVADARVREAPGATLDFAVTLSRAAAGAVTVAYRTVDGSARAGSDYTARQGTLSFAAGETAKTVRVAVLDDAHDEGEEKMGLVLYRASGAIRDDYVAVGTIENADPLPAAWLARFGRTAAGQVLAAVGERLRGGGQTQATVAGQRLQAADAEAVAAAQAAYERAWAQRLQEGRLQARPRAPAVRDLVAGSSFSVAAATDAGAAQAASAEPGGRWTVWGRGAWSRFAGNADGGALQVDGDVITATAGADYERGALLAGLALAYSSGSGTYEHDSERSGSVASTLLSVHPYARLALHERLAVWGLFGYGLVGHLALDDAAADAVETGTGLLLGAFGVDGLLLAAAQSGGLELAARADGLLLRMSSAAATGLAASAADLSRWRLLLEASYAGLPLLGGELRPAVAVGGRYDAGAAETGAGLVLSGRLSYALPALGLTLSAGGEGLLVHEEEGFREWGAGGSLHFDPGAPGRGLALKVEPSWGVAGSGAGRLWALPDAATLAPAAAQPSPGARLAAELSYGLDAPGAAGALTPYAGVALAADGARTWRLGTRLRLASGLAVSLEGTRAELVSAAEHTLALIASLRW